MKVAVGNLAKEATEDDLRALFEIFGKVTSVQFRRSGEAHVDMPNTTDARRAIEGLHGQKLLDFALELREIDEHRGPPRGKPRRRKRR